MGWYLGQYIDRCINFNNFYQSATFSLSLPLFRPFLPPHIPANHPDCNTFGTLGDYFNNEAGKNVTCPYFLRSGTTESDPPTSSTNLCPRPPDFLPPPNVNVSVSWCYESGVTHVVGVGIVTLCINATGHRDVSYSSSETSELVNHIENISVLDDGRLLHFPESSFTNHLQSSEVNCTVIAESDDQLQECGLDEFDLTILKRPKSKPMFNNAT